VELLKLRESLKLCQQQRLMNDESRRVHCDRNKRSQALRMARTDARFRQTQRNRSNLTIRRQKETLDILNKLKSKYLMNIKEGPTYECVCCCRLWFSCKRNDE